MKRETQSPFSFFKKLVILFGVNTFFYTDSFKQIVSECRMKYNKKFLFHLSKQYPDLDGTIQEFAIKHDLKDIKNKSQLLYHLVNGLKGIPKCKNCGEGVTTFGANRKWSYNDFCCRKCAATDSSIVEKRSVTRASRNYSVSNKLEILEEEALSMSYEEQDIKNLTAFLKDQKNLNNKKILFLHRYPKWFKIIKQTYGVSFEEGLYLFANQLKNKLANS